jgi:hypothetical protein
MFAISIDWTDAKIIPAGMFTCSLPVLVTCTYTCFGLFITTHFATANLVDGGCFGSSKTVLLCLVRDNLTEIFAIEFGE